MDLASQLLRSGSPETGAVILYARDVLGTAQRADEWLVSPQMLLGWVRPIDLLGEEPGRREVLRLLGAIEHGLPS